MSTSLTANLTTSLAATLSSVLAVGTAQYSPGLQALLQAALAQGTAADQAQEIYTGTNSLASGAHEDWDIYQPGVDPLGNTFTFSKIKILIIQILGNAVSGGVYTDADTLSIGNNGTAAAWLGFFSANTMLGILPSGTVKNPGTFMLVSGGTGGMAVTSGAHLLRLTNNSGSNNLAYLKLLIGV